MHAPGHAPKPLTGSQPTSLYDKYKRRAQRLLLIAWQKLRNPHFVLRTPDSYPTSFYQPCTPSSFSLPPPDVDVPLLRKKWAADVVVVVLPVVVVAAAVVADTLCLPIIFYT